jgi:CheY-like chemotaxis protein
MLVYAGRGSHVRKPADLSRLVADMLELLRASLPARCQLRHELAEDVWGELDDTQLRQVLLNLVSNAGESLGDRAGSVTIRTGKLHADAAYLADAPGARDPEPGAYVYVEVADDGPGIEAETQHRVFDPFFSTKFSGRGLGLAAVLGIVRGHGGVVKLSSSPEDGTRFRVLLPSAGELLVPLESRALEYEPAPAARSGRVLVVDDEDAVLEIAEEFLAREGFDAVTAGSGREAVRRFAAEPARFDAAVIDLAMPDLSGERVAAEIRTLRPQLPLVLASGFSAELAAARCLELGAARFLHKPYAPDDLVRAVRSVLEEYADLDRAPRLA